LRRALARKAKAYRSGAVAVAIVGPRSSFKMRKLKDKATGKVTRTKVETGFGRLVSRGGRRELYAMPSKYSHLVEKGTKRSSAFPALVYTEASRKTVMTYDGPTPTDRYGMTLQVYGKSAGAVKRAAAAVRARLLGYRGEATGGRFLGVFDEDESDGLDQPIHD